MSCLEKYSWDEIKGFAKRKELPKYCSKADLIEMKTLLKDPAKLKAVRLEFKTKNEAVITLQKGARKMENVKNFDDEPSWLKEAGVMMPTQQGIAPVYSQANEPEWLKHAGSLTLIDPIGEAKQREAYNAVTSKIRKLSINGKKYYLKVDTDIILNKEAFDDGRYVELGKLFSPPNGIYFPRWLK